MLTGRSAVDMSTPRVPAPHSATPLNATPSHSHPAPLAGVDQTENPGNMAELPGMLADFQDSDSPSEDPGDGSFLPGTPPTKKVCTN